MTRNRKSPMTPLWILVAAALALASASVAVAEEELPPIPYPLERCLVADEPLPAQGALAHVHGGRELRFCCDGCLKKFEADPQHYLEKMRAAVIEEQLPRYPLESCVVSGAELGSMGPPVDLLYRNRLVRLCCEGCRSAFEAEPNAALQKLGEAANAKLQKP